MRPFISCGAGLCAVIATAALAAPESWAPDPRRAALLSKEEQVEGYRIRPPRGYTPRVVNGPGTMYAWEAAPRPDGSHPALTVTIVHQPANDTHAYTASEVLDRFAGAIQKRRTNWTRTPTESGVINGMPFVRTRWVGTDQFTRRKMEGFQYAAVQGRTFVVLASEDLENQSEALQLAETALRTLRPARAGEK